jgi:predicted Fe-Mo cluster-binding NifX family protein
MRLCIPTQNDKGLDSAVYGYFGSAPYFIIYETCNKSIDVINNLENSHAHGNCNPLKSFEKNPIDIMITGGIGTRALQKLNAVGVRAYRTDAARVVADVIASFENNNLTEILPGESCGHHNCH